MAKLSKRQFRAYQTILDGRTPPACDLLEFWLYKNERVGAAAGAWLFAKEYGRRDGVDIKRLQFIILKSDSPEYAYKFARDIPGANIRRLQDVVIRYGTAHQLKVFAKNIPRANKGKLEAFILIKEIMEL
jgi:hypothetical protein